MQEVAEPFVVGVIKGGMKTENEKRHTGRRQAIRSETDQSTADRAVAGRSAAGRSAADRAVAGGCAIVLAYRDGEKYVGEQIKSIHRQTYGRFHIYVYDDASPLPFDAFAKERRIDLRKTTISRRQRNVGLHANFLKGLAESGDSHAYYAFSDQDDIWHDDKLARAVAWLERQPDGPALYFSSMRIVDSAGRKPIAKPVLFTRPITFANALVQSLVSGNALVMNKAARDLVVNTSRTTRVTHHDWWSSLIIAGAGGNIHFDPEPSIDYRQHESNDLGANLGITRKIRRNIWWLGGRFRQFTDTNVAALDKHRKLLTPENRCILDQFAAARRAWLPARIIGLRRSGISRQSLAGNIKLAIAVLLRKL